MKRLPKRKFDSATQDKVLRLLLMDTEFIGSIRRFMRPEYFSSELLRNLCFGIFEFYDVYSVAPNFEQLDGIMSTLVDDNIIDEDEIDVYITYLDRLMFDVETDQIVKEFLSDNLKEFAKHRVMDGVVKAIERGKKQGKDSDALYKYMITATEEVRSIMSESVAISMSEVVADSGTDVVSCFNVPPIDRQLGGGIQRGFFYIVLGFTGAGKTWTLVHLGKMAARFGYLVLHIVVELSNKVLKKRYTMALSGKPADTFAREHKYIKKIVKKSLVRKSNILFLDEEEKSEPIDSISKVVDDIVRDHGRKPDIILIDSAEDYAPPSGRKYRDEHQATEASFVFCKDFAREHNIAVVSTIQAQRRGETARWLTTGTVAGFIAKARKAVVGISINSYPQEKKAGFYRLLVFKNNEGEEGAKAWVKRDFSRGQSVLESGYMDSEYWDQFEWDEDN